MTDKMTAQKTAQQRNPIKALLAAAIGTAMVTACAPMAGDMGANLAAAAGVPQFAAFLPNKASVQASQLMEIDGVYTISTINKRIKLEGGRGYAVDPWLHAFTLKVQPDMVVLQNISQTGENTYTADDLPLMAKASFTVLENGTIQVVTQGALGPANYSLIPAQ